MARTASFVFMLLSSFLVGCATHLGKDRRPDQVLSLELQATGALQGKQVLHVWMGPVVGGLMGYPGAHLIDRNLSMPAEHEFQVSLTAIETGLAAAAQTDQYSNLKFDPQETRVARLSTIAQDVYDRLGQTESGFKERDSGRPLTLIYVDRPCSIRGVAAGTPAVSYDLVLDHAGLYWLRFDDSGGSVPFRVTLAGSQSHVIYSVAAVGQKSPVTPTSQLRQTTIPLHLDSPASQDQMKVIREATKMSLACTIFRDLFDRWPKDISELESITTGIDFGVFMGKAEIHQQDDSLKLTVFDGAIYRSQVIAPQKMGIPKEMRDASTQPNFKIAVGEKP